MPPVLDSEYERKTAKLKEVIDTYGVNSEEFKNYQKKHTSNKYGLLYIYRRFGIKSKIFFEYIRPFIIKQMNRFTYNDFDDDLVSACYIHMVEAHCGGYSEKIDKTTGEKIKVWKDAYVDDMETISATKWINFLVTICRSTVCNRDYHFNKHAIEISHNDRLDDALGNSRLDSLNYSSYSFKHFIFENSLKEHIEEIFRYKPSNSVLYNLVQWNLAGDDLDAQQPTSYNFGGKDV